MTDEKRFDTDEIREEIPDALAGQRIDRVVALIADVSRKDAADAVTEGRVQINGRTISKASHRVAVGDRVDLVVHRFDTSLTADPSVEVPVVYEDDHMLVINKPAGMVVHPGAGVDRGTMVHGLLHRYPDIAGVGPDTRPGVVHRLDKGTSGLLMVARTEAALAHLSGQLAVRTVLRRYITLVDGRVESAEGLIDAPLGRSPRDATRHAVIAGGRPARTRYEVVERFTNPEATLVHCRLETGRTHQIRVHLEAIGHSVVGDDRYGMASEELDRPFLHAATLGFEHPDSGDWLSFDAELPADLDAVLTARRVASDSDV